MFARGIYRPSAGGVSPSPDPDPDPDPSPSVDLANITTLRNAGHPVPDPDNWWIEHPTAAAIKAALIDPKLNDSGGDGVCIRRLWIPQTFEAGNYDTTQAAVIAGRAGSAHQAINAHLEAEIEEDQSASDAAMANAISYFNTHSDARIASDTEFPAVTGSIVISNRCRSENTAVLALDWIKWDDYTDFEAAFAKVKTMIENQIASEESSSRNFRYIASGDQDGEGYINATHAAQSAFFLEPLLALSVYGVNTGGASHTWADGIIDKIGVDPLDDATAVYSPWHQRNLLGLISLGVGGGGGWGAEEKGPSLGGYEEQYAYSATMQMRAVDTATNSAWSMVDDCIYLQTRYLGLEVELDKTVRKSLFSSGGYGCVGTWAALLGDTTAGRRYSRLLGTQTESGYLRMLRALAGPVPTTEAPSGSFAGPTSGKWAYRADLSDPSGTFRVDVAKRDIDCWREAGDDRTLSFCIGSVGLVKGHANRCNALGVLANGLWIGEKATSVDPLIAVNEWWGKGFSILPYYNAALRYVMPLEVATESDYVIGSQTQPALADGHYTWTLDLSSYSGVYNGTGGGSADPRFTGLVSAYDLDINNQILQITDTVTVDLSDGLYLGWHFSPSHTASLDSANVFSFTDATDEIEVTIEPLGDFGWTRTVRTPASDGSDDVWDQGSYNLEIEWHASLGGNAVHRIAQNIGFEPDSETDDDVYQVRTTIKANPS